MVICLERGADLHMAQLMPLPLTTFLVPAHPGRAVKRVCLLLYLMQPRLQDVHTTICLMALYVSQLENWSPNSLELNSVDTHCGGVDTDGILSQNFTHVSAAIHANGLLGSAKPGHIEPSNRSEVKRLMMIIKARVHIKNFVSTVCANYRCRYFHCLFQ